MKIKKPITGILAFLIVLFAMPLGHAVMIIMEKAFGDEYVFIAAVTMGFAGLLFLVLGYLSKNETKATFWGLFASLFIWTGWVEFSFVYFAKRFGIDPLIANGEVVTKPEYLLMPSSLPFLVIFVLYYFFGSKTGCSFFNWLQRQFKVSGIIEYKPVKRNMALTTFMELTMLLWTFYLVLLFAYDENFFGDRHPVTYILAFGSLFWSIYLFMRLVKISAMGRAIRYSIPTVIIFWNFVEILGRWDLFKELWVEPQKYRLEMLLTLIVFIILLVISLRWRRKAAD